jgi:Flp pilus assembly pilin Flp
MIGKLEQTTTNYNNSGGGFLTSAPRPSTMTNGPVASFHEDDRGEHAIEFLMILTFGVLPLIVAVYLLEDVLQEYVAFSQIFVSSPFF